MKAIVQDVVLAEAPTADLVTIEGNWYFPPSSVANERLSMSGTPYTCPRKGVARYYDVGTGAHPLRDAAAWSYPTPERSAIDRVGADFSSYLTFDTSQVAVGE